MHRGHIYLEIKYKCFNQSNRQTDKNGDGGAVASKAARASDAMKVGGTVARHGAVYHQIYVLRIDAARCLKYYIYKHL